MIEIYDEVSYIKVILEKGLDFKNLRRDCKLLARFYADADIKKAQCKILLKEKAEKIPSYDKHRHYAIINKAVDEAYRDKKDGKQLREVREIIISKEILKWFLNLESDFKITNEQVAFELENRHIRLSNHPINFNRTKFLFTLYIWTRIQSNYVKYPYAHYLQGVMKKFKEDADLPLSFQVNKEKRVLYDLGLLHVTLKDSIDVKFVKDNSDLFNVEFKDLPEEEKIVISGNDLYECGKWLEKQKYGSYVCQNCGKEVPYKGLGKGEKSRKYCEDCSKKVNISQTSKRRKVQCLKL